MNIPYRPVATHFPEVDRTKALLDKVFRTSFTGSDWTCRNGTIMHHMPYNENPVVQESYCPIDIDPSYTH